MLCCSVLQCVAVCCSVLQCAAVCCSVLQCVAVCCSVLQFVAVCCSSGSEEIHSRIQLDSRCNKTSNFFKETAEIYQKDCWKETYRRHLFPGNRPDCVESDSRFFSTRQCQTNRLQHTATHCNMLQHAAKNS